jgi:hypothetical protein
MEDEEQKINQQINKKGRIKISFLFSYLKIDKKSVL